MADPMDYNSYPFPFTRFMWLIEFSLDHNWYAVVNALLDVLFGGKVDLGQHGSVKLALTELCVLHRAVKRNDQSMVELLLRYVPRKVVDEARSRQWHQESGTSNEYIFKPDDVSGPDRIAPLHITASISGSECVLDALTDDPGQVGVEAWMNARDSSGLTPEDYASIHGFQSYIHLVQRKINEEKSENQNVVVDIIPSTTLNLSSFHAEMTQSRCKFCANHKQDRLGATRKQ